MYLCTRGTNARNLKESPESKLLPGGLKIVCVYKHLYLSDFRWKPFKSNEIKRAFKAMGFRSVAPFHYQIAKNEQRKLRPCNKFS